MNETSRDGRPRIAVTMGDPAGVGPELCLRLLANHELTRHSSPLVFGDMAILREVAIRCGLPAPTSCVGPEDWSRDPAARIVNFDHRGLSRVVPGEVAATCGKAAYSYIAEAIQAALRGDVAAIVTAPIHKEALAAAGVSFPGHTEILADQTGAKRYVMMLTSPAITCALVTAHIGLRDVPQSMTTERVFDTIDLTAEAMRAMLGREPTITVCGLNPHAGEHGLFGAGEEDRCIVPAIAQAKDLGIDARGPLPADTAFLPRVREVTDAYVCMYHDQGLIPLKMLAFDEAVNVTLGLPIVRTSVDHGTAFDIAWKGLASPNSLFEAYRLAVRLAARSPRLQAVESSS